MRFLSTILVFTLLVSVFAVFPVSAADNTTISFKEIAGLELGDISRISIESGTTREEVSLDPSLANELFTAFQSARFKVKTDNENVNDWSYMVFIYTLESDKAPKFKYSFPVGVIHKGEMYVLEDDTNLLKLVESMFSSLAKEPEDTAATKEPKHITLYEFLNPANNVIESVRITKPLDIGNEKQTNDRLKISEFMRFAKTVDITLCDERNVINRDGYFITVNGSVSGEQWWGYAFISDGGVDRYSLAMSRSPWSLYTLDDQNVLTDLEQFYNGFNDKIADDWALPEIERAIWLEILPEHLQNGYMENITREKFCELIYELLIKKPSEDFKNTVGSGPNGGISGMSYASYSYSYFNDCLNEKVGILYYNGIVAGKDRRIFDPNGFLTRQEAAAILYRLMLLYGLHCDTQTAKYDNGAEYSDLNNVADWAKDAVNAVANAGIMKGDGSYFLPNSPYTHQQAIATVMRLYDAVIKQTTLVGKYDLTISAEGYIDAMPYVGELTEQQKAERKYIVLGITSPRMSELRTRLEVLEVKAAGHSGNLNVTPIVMSTDTNIAYRISGDFIVPTTSQPLKLQVTIKDNSSGETETVELNCAFTTVH